jgi:hypothetical protein
VGGYVSGESGTPVAVSGQGIQLARTHLDDSEFASDKKAVERNSEPMASSLRRITPGASQTTAALPKSTVSTALMETLVADVAAKWTFME